MGKRDLMVHLIHDDNVLAQAARLGLADTDRCTPFGSHGAADEEAALVVVHASGQGWEDIVARQAAARAAGQALLFVTVEPGSVLIGPLLKPDGAGCFLCLKAWLANNHRDANRWYNARPGSAMRRRDALGPVAPAAQAACQAQVDTAIAAWRDGGTHRLERAVVRLDLDTLASQHHRFLARAHCPHCANVPADSAALATLALQPRLKANAADDRVPNPSLSLAKLRADYVDHRTGMVPHVFHDMTSRLMPMFAAEMPIANSKTVEVGYGRSETRLGSEMVAILETIERFAGHEPRGKKTSVRASYAEVRADAIDPRAFILHQGVQAQEPGFTLRPYDDDLVFDWVWGYSFARKKPVLVPQQLVYYWLPNKPDKPINRFLFDTSSGCALGGCLEEAMLYGLLEVIERDAYLSTWYNQYTPVEVDLDTIADDKIQAVIVRSRAEGFELHVFDIRQDIDVPVFWALIVDPREDAPVKSYCAAGAHLRPERAIYGALVEVTTSMGVYQRTLPALREDAMAMLGDGSRVRQMSDHVLLYSVPESYERLAFLFGGRKAGLAELHPRAARTRSLDLTEDLLAQVEKVLGVAQDVIVVDQGFADMRTSGLSCAKVLVPGLLSMTFGHQYRRVSLERLRKSALATGLPPPASLADLNPHPHNFP